VLRGRRSVRSDIDGVGLKSSMATPVRAASPRAMMAKRSVISQARAELQLVRVVHVRMR
jgi:hypothetical protein